MLIFVSEKNRPLLLAKGVEGLLGRILIKLLGATHFLSKYDMHKQQVIHIHVTGRICEITESQDFFNNWK